MSENDNLSPSPSKQTSSVPLKKETVRVTLKAADAPPAVPSATVPLAPPVRPPIPGGAPPTPTAPPMAPPRPTAPAPTIPLRTAGAPMAPSPAPTIRLATSSPGAPTGPLKMPGLPTTGGSPTLPKATVQLQAPTQPLGTSFPSTPTQAATFQMEEDEEEEAHGTLFKILSGVGFAAALGVLIFQLMIAKIWINVEDNPKPGDWSQLLE